MRSHLLNDTTAEQYRRSVTEGVERVAAKLAATDRPFTGITVDALAPASTGSTSTGRWTTPPPCSTSWRRSTSATRSTSTTPATSPTSTARSSIPAVLGEAVLSAVNSSLDTWDQSAGGTLIERRLIDWTTARIGLGPAADGIFTSGGSQSNLQALLLAREEAKSDSPAKLRIFASEVSHFSVKKSAKLLGLEPDAVDQRPRRPRQAHADRRARPRAGALQAGRPRPHGRRRHRRHHRLRLDRPAARGRRAVPAVRRLDARRRRLRLRAARLRQAPGPHRRHRARRLRHRRLPQVLLPAREFLRAAGAGRGHAAARHLPRRVPQPAPHGATNASPTRWTSPSRPPAGSTRSSCG